MKNVESIYRFGLRSALVIGLASAALFGYEAHQADVKSHVAKAHVEAATTAQGLQSQISPDSTVQHDFAHEASDSLSTQHSESSTMRWDILGSIATLTLAGGAVVAIEKSKVNPQLSEQQVTVIPVHAPSS